MTFALIVNLTFENVDWLLFSIPYGISILGFGLSAAFYKRFKVIGHVIFQENKISITKYTDEIIIPINQITKLTFFYRGIKGDSFEWAPAGIGFFGFKDGAGNLLILETSDDRIIINLLIISDSEYYELTRWWFKVLTNQGTKVELKEILGFNVDEKTIKKFNKNKTTIANIR